MEKNSFNEQNIYDFIKPFWETAIEPFILIDGMGVIQDVNPPASRYPDLAPLTSLVEKISEKKALIHALDESYTESELRIVEPLTLSINPKETIQIALRLFPLTQKPKLFLAGIEKKHGELDLLQETVRLHDQRVEQLSQKLYEVSQELLHTTLQLAEQKNKLNGIITSMNEGLLACDEKGSIIHFNQSAKDLLSLPDDIRQGSLAELCPALAEAVGFDPQSPRPLIQKSIDFPFKKLELRISTSTIFDEGKHIAGYVMIFEDRTKQAEVDRLKADLISIVSHELRSPLTSIKGYIDLMISGDLGEIPNGMTNYLDIISSNANRLAALIDDMLDLARIESGKLSMSFGKVDVRYLCDYVFLTMKPQAEKKHIRFTMDLKTVLSVSGDVDRLQQALTNLVSNAIKYTAEGGEVSIQAEARDQRLLISVRDTGVGIAAEDQKKLFQRFFRVKNKATRNIGGTGLGLCIAKSIIEAQEGTIYVESAEGQGSCFTIDMPVYHP
ncbi:MAG: ATP-binding protein [Candidatus Omnitrophota bacterium]